MWRWILGLVLATGIVVALAVKVSILLVAAVLVGGVAILYSYFFFPKKTMVGWMASIAIAMVVVFPVHLVPTELRYAELGLLALMAVITALHRGLAMRPWVPVLLLIYFGLTWWSTSVAEIEGSAFQFLSHFLVGLVFLLFGAKANVDERKIIVRTTIQLGALESLYALYEYVAQPTVLWASPVPEKWEWMASRLANEILTGGLRSQGTFGHPLLLSFLLIVALGLTLRYPFKVGGMRFVLVGLFFAGAVAAGSRSATIIMVAVALFMYGMSKLAWVRGVFIGLAGLTLASLSSFFTSAIVERFSESGSLSHRQGAVDAVPRLLAGQDEFQVLFGNGWYSTQTVYDRGLLQLDGFVAIDNQFVALLVTTGVVGLVVFALLLAITFKIAKRDVRPALLAAGAVFLVFDVLEFPGTWAFMALLMGLSVAGITIHEKEPEKEAPEPGVGKGLPEWVARNQEMFARSAEQRTHGA